MKNNKFGKSAIILTGSRIITHCITLVTAMLLSRFRSFEEYGTYSELLLIISLATSLLMLGLPSSINFFLARADGAKGRNQFLSLYYSVSTILSFAIGILLVGAIPLIELYFHNPSISEYYFFLAFFPWSTIISSSIDNVLIVYNRSGLLLAYRVTHSLLILGAVLTVEVLGLGFRAYILIYLIINCAFALFVYYIASNLSGRLVFCLNPGKIRELFLFSIPLGLASVVGTLNLEIDKLLIGYLMNTEQLAIYTNAAKELPLTFISSSLTAVLLPRVTLLIKEKQESIALEMWKKTAELSFIFISIIVTGVVIFAEDAMTLLYSEKYLPGVNIFRVYTLVILFRITYFGMFLNAFGRTKGVLVCSIVSLLSNAILNPLLFSVFGMIGPALATLIAILIAMIIQLFWTSKLLHIKLLQVMPWFSLLMISSLNALLGVVFWYLKSIVTIENLIGSIAESVFLGAVMCAFYFFFMYKRIREDWHYINQNGVLE